MDGDGFFVLLLIFLGLLILFSVWQNAVENNKKRELNIERRNYLNKKFETDKRNKSKMNNTLSSMDSVEANLLRVAMQDLKPTDTDFRYKFNQAVKSIPIPTDEELEKRRKEEKLDLKKRQKAAKLELEKRQKAAKLELEKKRKVKELEPEINKAKFILIKKKLYPLEAPINKTGDSIRFKDFEAECSRDLRDKYLYLVKIKSNIDDRKFIKVGVSTHKDIKKRFEDDDVIELIEVIRSIKFDSRAAMAIEYHLIQKHRPKDYFAEEEFDVFSKFSGYTEVIPMRYATAVTKDIDLFEKDSLNIGKAFQLVNFFNW
jgi:hypothetical protein